MNRNWSPLPHWRSALIEALMGGPDAPARGSLMEQLLEMPSDEVGCWQLVLRGREEDRRLGAVASPFVGDAADVDGVPIQAVLTLDRDAVPMELEVMRLDGKPLQTPVEALSFTFVREG
jgi:hypothetical protein